MGVSQRNLSSARVQGGEVILRTLKGGILCTLYSEPPPIRPSRCMSSSFEYSFFLAVCRPELSCDFGWSRLSSFRICRLNSQSHLPCRTQFPRMVCHLLRCSISESPTSLFEFFTFFAVRLRCSNSESPSLFDYAVRCLSRPLNRLLCPTPLLEFPVVRLLRC
jgi:hypothetical protein